MIRSISIVVLGLFLSVSAQDDGAAGQAGLETHGQGGGKEEAPGGRDSTAEKIAELEGRISGIEESYLETKATVNKLAKLKVSGYLQAQFQVAETAGVQTSLAGSKFDKGTQSRFFVRRGRIKFNYDNGLSQYVLQFDASHGGFEIKDAYLSFTEPWLRYFTGTMGIFDRPFGFEISYSSSMRESPERSRIYQTLFPKEREVGAKLAFNASSGLLSYFNFKGGVFNGVTTLQLENDATKDFIGRIGFEVPLREAGMGIDGGFSGYHGYVTNTDTVEGGRFYEMDGTSFTKKSGQNGGEFVRNYYGADLQYYLDIPIIGGLTLRSEYLWGVQPGTGSKTSFYQPTAGGVPNGAVYSRNFSGWYLYWVQCWGSRLQSVLKYDKYDPNIDVEKDDIGLDNSGTSSADVSFGTFGFGLIYNWDENLKFMAYYDMPRNEESKNVSGYGRDISDDVFTLRLQYKF